MSGDNPDKKYVAVVLPPIFDLDEYLNFIGFHPKSGFNYVNGNKKIIIADNYFCCLEAEDDVETGTQVETIKCQLSFIPDVWMMNMILMEIDFIDELF